METGEGNHVDSQLPEVGVELSGEPEAGGDAGHGQGDQVVQVAVGRVSQLQGSGTNDQFRIIFTTRLQPEADVVERLVVDTECLVSVLHQLVDREGGVVGLYHRVRHLAIPWVSDEIRSVPSDWAPQSSCS